jgi:hypothetical protein
MTSRKNLLAKIKAIPSHESGIPFETFKQLAVSSGYTPDAVIKNTTLTDMFIYRGGMAIPRARFFRTMAELFEGETVNEFSMGIEFEGGIIGSDGEFRRGQQTQHYARINKFRMQQDPTAAFEIMTPPETKFDNMAKDVGAQWQHWTQMNPSLAPYWRSEHFHKSMGHHIHLGKPTRTLPLAEKKQIAMAAIPVLPALYFVSANHYKNTEQGPVLSSRMLTSSYCQPLRTRIVSGSHYDEISDSANGTVEFRSFDANFPQVTLSVAYLLKAAAEMNASKKPTRITEIEEREIIEKYVKLRHDVIHNNIQAFLKARETLRQELGPLKIPDFQFIREVLYLSFVIGENPAVFVRKLNHPICKKMVDNPEKFFDNISFEKKTSQKIINKMKADAANYDTIEKFCSGKLKVYSKIHLNRIWTQLVRETQDKEKAAQVLQDNFLFDDKWFAKVKTGIKTKRVKPKLEICRLSEFPNMTAEEGAAAILSLIVTNEPGEFNANEATRSVVNSIIESQDRFYLVHFQGKIIGYLRTNTSEHAVKSWHIPAEHKEALKKIVKTKFGRFTIPTEAYSR